MCLIKILRDEIHQRKLDGEEVSFRASEVMEASFPLFLLVLLFPCLVLFFILEYSRILRGGFFPIPRACGMH